jgi:Sulfotransferase family
MRVKLVHVIRNPYDNISTISMKTSKLERKGDLKRCMDFYFSLCESVEEIKAQTDESDFFDLRHEAFLERPRDRLRDLCNFLGVASSDEHLDACAMVVSGSPRKSRYEAQWSEALIELVDSKMRQVPFLCGYSYSD